MSVLGEGVYNCAHVGGRVLRPWRLASNARHGGTYGAFSIPWVNKGVEPLLRT